jgi:hypothetical protein
MLSGRLQLTLITLKGRILKRGRTVGPYSFSIHDVRLGRSTDNETIWQVGGYYWSGVRADAVELQSMGKPGRAQSREVLFYGRLDFPNKALVPD